MANISVTAKKGRTQFLIRKPLSVTVGGTEHAIPWGTTADIPVGPGQHEVQASFSYMGRQAGKVSRAVTVGDDGVRLRYKTPFLVTSAGRLDPV